MKLDMFAFTGVWREEAIQVMILFSCLPWVRSRRRSTGPRFAGLSCKQLRVTSCDSKEQSIHLLRIGSERDLWIFGKELIRFSRDTSTWERVGL